MSDTSPSETARIAAITGNDPYRNEVLITLTILKERSDHQTEWMRKHDEADSKRFDALEQRLGGVSSNVGSLETDRATVVGIRDAFYTVCKALAVLIGAGWAVWLTFFHKGSP